MVIENHKSLSIRRQTELLGINRSMLYYEESDNKKDFILSNKIAEIYAQYPMYGYRRITAILRREGFSANRKKIHRLMREMNLYAIYPKPNTSKKGKQKYAFPYLLNDIVVNKAHQVWQVDITYLRTVSGFVYLVAVIDVYSRMIVGYRLSNNLCVESCKSALEDAILSFGVPSIVNSDQGSQFTSDDWIELLSFHKIKISMTGKGRCNDNAYIERLWRAFKYEGSLLYHWNTIAAIKNNIKNWITWYNFKRPHQSLDYSTPADILLKTLGSNNFYLNSYNLNIVQEVIM